MSRYSCVWLALSVLLIAQPATSQVVDQADNFIDMQAPQGQPVPAVPADTPTGPLNDLDTSACPATGCPTSVPVPLGPAPNPSVAVCSGVYDLLGSSC